ncbi:MAG: hypothetical protein KGJ02_04570 [Verrucomicrobiota bacterium]|nr:hypothetical protein [Verrucomicrobiota bacterium]
MNLIIKVYQESPGQADLLVVPFRESSQALQRNWIVFWETPPKGPDHSLGTRLIAAIKVVISLAFTILFLIQGVFGMVCKGVGLALWPKRTIVRFELPKTDSSLSLPALVRDVPTQTVEEDRGAGLGEIPASGKDGSSGLRKPGPLGPGNSHPNLGGVRNSSQIIPRPLGRGSLQNSSYRDNLTHLCERAGSWPS